MRFIKDESGAVGIVYALIAASISLMIIAVLLMVDTKFAPVLNAIKAGLI